ncbi:MAG: hypothetical protein OXH70_15800, partial [Acidobacteria bacterium]|nr:hypothetical protein [Acidobacteriota bacterium]
MSGAEKPGSPTVHGDESATAYRGEKQSPGFRRFIFWCVVLYYGFFAVGVFLMSSERSSVEQLELPRFRGRFVFRDSSSLS